VTVEALLRRAPTAAVFGPRDDATFRSALAAHLRALLADVRPVEAQAKRLSGRRIVAVGTGTSWHAANHAVWLLREAGIEAPAPLYLPLVRATLDNVESIGADRALTGPAVRGDAGTIGRNLEALSVAAPDAIPAYVALARVALDLAEHAGRLPPEDRRRVEEALARWR